MEHIIARIEKLAELDTNVSAQTWYHGAGAPYKSLIEGDGIDGKGVYLTNDENRAKMYAKRDTHGRDNPFTYLHKVKVHLNPDKVWDNTKEIDLRDFTDAQWLTDMINQYGEKAAYKDGMNAKIYLGFKNEDLQKLGYDAILTYSDLIVFDPKDTEIVDVEQF